MKPVYLDPNVEIPPKEKTINKKSKRLNARQRRQLGIYDIPKEALKYENFVPLHDLWLGYMKELYGSGGQDIKTFAQKLLKADFHGAIFTVVKSINPVLVGISGIVIQETQNIFSIITKDNKLKSKLKTHVRIVLLQQHTDTDHLAEVPKANTVFTMKLDVCAHTFTLYGQQFICRSAERAARKFKAKPTIDI